MKREKRGLLITLEGPEGSGKTTLAKEIERYLEMHNIQSVMTFEPGGSSLGLVLRKALLDSGNRKISPRAELFLFEADRAQHIEETILPGLSKKQVVICCRYFDSTTAYQGYGRGLNIKWITQLNQYATNGLEPDLTLLLDVSPEEGLPRAFKARGKKDRMEQEAIDFHHRLRKGYLALAKKNPKRFRVIDASQDFGTVKEEALKLIKKALRISGYIP